jgi:integrating conjugative element protein (TIGR03758 family)
MSDAQRLAFQLGSGADAATVLLGIASVVVVLALIWAMWITFGAFRSWQDGSVSLFDVAWSVLRVSILLMVLGYYIR